MSNSMLDIYKKIAEASAAGIKAASESTRASNEGVSVPLAAPSVKPANPVGTALDKNYAAQSQNALDKYNTAQKELEESRVRAKKEAGFNNTKLMKYMPSILKRQGLSGLGVSQSAVIAANNNYGRQLTDIENDFQKNSADLLQNYNDAKLAYDTQYNTQNAQLEQAELDKAEAKAKAKNNEIAGNIEIMINSSSAKTIEELVTELGITLGEGQDFNAYIDSLGLEPHVASYLKSLAAQKVSANNTAAGEKKKLEQEQLFAENYKMAYDAIVNDSMTTDFSEYLGQFVAGENISESQLSNLKMLAASQAAENELANNSEVKDTALLEISALCLEEKYKEASEILEANKAIIGEGMYSYYKSIIDPKLEQGGGKGMDKPPVNPYQQGPGYSGMTEEQLEQRIIDGLDYLPIDGRAYQLTGAVESDSVYLTDNADFLRKLKNEGYTNPSDANIPDGTIISFKGTKNGSLNESAADTFELLEKDPNDLTRDEKEYLYSTELNSYIANLEKYPTYTLIFYNGQWHTANDMGEAKKTELDKKSDPLGVYAPFATPKTYQGGNVVSSIFDKYKQ